MNMKQLANYTMAAAVAVALLAAATGTAQAYNKMPGMEADLEFNHGLAEYNRSQPPPEPPLPTPGEWPQSPVVWEECAAYDEFGIQECYLQREGGSEEYWYERDGKTHQHYPLDPRTPSTSTGDVI